MVDMSVERRAIQQAYVLMEAIQNPEAFREKLNEFTKTRDEMLTTKGAAIAALTELNEGRRSFEEERASFEKANDIEQKSLDGREKRWPRLKSGPWFAPSLRAVSCRSNGHNGPCRAVVAMWFYRPTRQAGQSQK